MGLAEIRAELKAIIAGVIGIGPVHDYERWSADWNSYLSFFKLPGQENINGWTITRVSTSEEAHAQNQDWRRHKFLLKGYYSQKDSAGSEKVFQDLIEAVCHRLRINPQLDGAAAQSDPPQVETVETRFFGDILCHYAEISIVVQEDETFVPLT